MLSVRIQERLGSLVAERQWIDVRDETQANYACARLFEGHGFDRVCRGQVTYAGVTGTVVEWQLALGGNEIDMLMLDLLLSAGDLTLYGPVPDPQDAEYRVIIEAPR